MVIPDTFGRRGVRAIATYNFTDIAEGTGINKFWFFTSETNGGADEHISTNQSYSMEIETDYGITSITNLVLKTDEDYDLSEFNLPKTIEGTAIANIGFRVNASSGTIGGAVKVLIRKWDGSSETEIAQGFSQEITTTGEEKVILVIPITIPKTHFKKGETLRVTLQGYGRIGSIGNSGNGTIGHDPFNSDGANIIPSTDSPRTITSSNINIPFNLDL